MKLGIRLFALLLVMIIVLAGCGEKPATSVDKDVNIQYLPEKVENPDNLIEYMNQKGMECNKHYPVPCHLQKAYKNLGYQEGDCPNAEYLASHCVTLPLFPEMTDEEVEMVIAACNAYTGK